jgi:hypothetical protein
MIVGASFIALASVVAALLPPSPQYISGRFVAPDPYAVYGKHSIGGNNLTQVAKFEVALLLIAVAVTLLWPSSRGVRRLAAAWATSALVGAAVAITDSRGLTHIKTNVGGFRRHRWPPVWAQPIAH